MAEYDDGETRLYDIHVPSIYDGLSVPLIIDFHGFGVGKTIQALISGLKSLSDTEGFI